MSITARIKDRGKGIGRIEWRVNGVTVDVKNAPEGAGPVYEVKQDIALDPGENAIEVVAYNASNLLGSLPAKATLTYSGPADAAKPKLHVLAIGIDLSRPPEAQSGGCGRQGARGRDPKGGRWHL